MDIFIRQHGRAVLRIGARRVQADGTNVAPVASDAQAQFFSIELPDCDGLFHVLGDAHDRGSAEALGNAIAVRFSEAHVEAAMCLWEEALRLIRKDALWQRAHELHGMAQLRALVMAAAKDCDADYQCAVAQDAYDDCFDWEFVPQWLSDREERILEMSREASDLAVMPPAASTRLARPRRWMQSNRVSQA